MYSTMKSMLAETSAERWYAGALVQTTGSDTTDAATQEQKKPKQLDTQT